MHLHDVDKIPLIVWCDNSRSNKEEMKLSVYKRCLKHLNNTLRMGRSIPGSQSTKCHYQNSIKDLWRYLNEIMHKYGIQSTPNAC